MTTSQAPVGAALPQDVREREYSPSFCIGGNYQPFLQQYASRSAVARQQLPASLGLAYGDKPSNTLDLFLPAGASSAAQRPPLLLFIHGGYWQELSKNESLFAAADCIAAGAAFAALDYTLAPDATLAQMVCECRNALRWLQAHATALGFDPQRILVAGSSAGAHLAAMSCLRAWPGDADLPPGLPAAAALVSGIYDLQPLIGTSINDKPALTADSAAAVSPQFFELTGFPPSLVCWGAIETGEFKRQSRAFAQALDAAAAGPLAVFESPGRNHFDVILDLARPGSALGDATLQLLRALRT